MDIKGYVFEKAVPVWREGKEREMNICMDFVFEAKSLDDAFMRITGSSFYQVFVNGEICWHGPARVAEGYTVVDVIALPKASEAVEIAVRVVGYNCCSFNGINNPSFAQIEISDGGRILAATGRFGFKYYSVPAYIQKVVRYSSQRQFSECWDLRRRREPCEAAVTDIRLKYLMRNTPGSGFAKRNAVFSGEERYKTVDSLKMPLFSYLVDEPENFDCFHYDELEEKPLEEYLKTRIDKAGEKRLERWEFGNIEAGFFRLEGEASEDSAFILVFAEQLGEDGRPNLKSVDSCNVIKVSVPKGKFTMYSVGPYTSMYMEVLHLSGEMRVKSVSIHELAYPEENILPFEIEDDELSEIYDAAVRTFRHNTLDIYMDCPSRERAGWLFDSFYTARAEYGLTGECNVEKAFLRNYLYGGARKEMGGITEMCYPANVYSRRFVPQWSMWYIQELCEYFTARKHMEEMPLYENQLLNIVSYYENYENEYGLLERLGGWNFVEWSRLNERVFDVSWATNMLYADSLYKIGVIYQKKDLIQKAVRLKQTIRHMAFDGRMFCDRAVRDEKGRLVNTDEYSETTQYYAMYFGVGEEQELSAARSLALGEITADKVEGYTDVEPSDALPGLYLRIELLLRMEEYEKALEFIKQYFGEMAHQTGTLWERKSGVTSRNHGFASYVAVAVKEAYTKLKQKDKTPALCKVV